MPKLKDSFESALGEGAEKKKAEKAAKAAAKKEKAEENSPARAHIQVILGRHRSLPAALVDQMYQCKSKGQVRRLLRDHLRAEEIKLKAAAQVPA